MQNQPSNLHRSACVNSCDNHGWAYVSAPYRDPTRHNSRFHGRIIAILWNPTRNCSRPSRKTAAPSGEKKFLARERRSSPSIDRFHNLFIISKITSWRKLGHWFETNFTKEEFLCLLYTLKGVKMYHLIFQVLVYICGSRIQWIRIIFVSLVC